MEIRHFAVFGNPIQHSLSPCMHNFTFEHLAGELGFLGRYEALLLENGRDLRQEFLKRQLSGANITLPFKQEAFWQCDEVIGIARDIGAVNTWVLKSGRILGYNTDAMGFYESIKDLGLKRVLILGAGGSARAIAFILKQKKIEVSILNRSASRLQDFRADFSCFDWQEFLQHSDFSFDMVINTTSASLDGTLPFSLELLERLFLRTKFAYDLVYGKMTPFLSLAEQRGCKIQDGALMLINQGALAFLLFSDSSKKTECIASLMRQALSHG